MPYLAAAPATALFVLHLYPQLDYDLAQLELSSSFINKHVLLLMHCLNSTVLPLLHLHPQLDYNLSQLELSSSFINEQPPAGQEPLAQLTTLQVLAANIPSLVRQAAYPSLTQLACLRELHIDMVGSLEGTCISSAGGLPTLPHLTRLVMTIAPQVRRQGRLKLQFAVRILQRP